MECLVVLIFGEEELRIWLLISLIGQIFYTMEDFIMFA